MMKCICDGDKVIKYGFNYFNNQKTQKYKCKDCNRIFSHENRLPKKHVSSDVMSLCIDLYLKGLSYRVIKQHILEQYGIKIGHVTIYNWIQMYSNKIRNYIHTFNPKLSTRWEIDETFIPIKNTIGRKMKKSDGYWCWICIDVETRYVLDMHLSKTRVEGSCRQFFKKLARYNAQPTIIITDGLVSYNYFIKKYYPKAKHVKIKKLTKEPKTSFIERYNGTIKNRTKTMRCFNSFYPCRATLTAFQIYYNFLRPHQSLHGKTPAKVACVDLDVSQRWASLIKYAVS